MSENKWKKLEENFPETKDKTEEEKINFMLNRLFQLDIEIDVLEKEYEQLKAERRINGGVARNNPENSVL